MYLCISEEERALNKRVFSSFFGQKNGCFTSEVEKNTSEINFFLGVCGFFLSNIGGFFADAERLKVKRYLFFETHFLGERMKEEGRGRERKEEEGTPN